MLGRHVRSSLGVGIDLGQPLGELGEWRIGLVRQMFRIQPESVYTVQTEAGSLALQSLHAREEALRSTLVMDQLDHAVFPRSGWRLRLEAQTGRRRLDELALQEAQRRFHRVELDLAEVASRGRHTVDLTLKLRAARQSQVDGAPGHYTLGGFHQLSGYETDQLSGDGVLLGRLTWQVRLTGRPVLTRGVFAGMTLEAGNAWALPREMRLTPLRWGTSAFLAADTGIGPLYLGLTWAPQGRAGITLRLGRP